MQINSQLNQHSGFSLIELLVTMAIMGVLATISMGVFVEYTDRTRMTEVELLRRDLMVVSNLLMQSLDTNTNPNAACSWRYDPIAGNDVSQTCESTNGKNTYTEVFNLNGSKLVVDTSFQFSNTYGPAGWVQNSTIVHCKIKDANNVLNLILTSNDDNTSVDSYYRVEPSSVSRCGDS